MQSITKKRVLIINYEYPPIGGGAATFTRYLAENLSKKKGFQISVLTSQYINMLHSVALEDETRLSFFVNCNCA